MIIIVINVRNHLDMSLDVFISNSQTGPHEKEHFDWFTEMSG